MIRPKPFPISEREFHRPGRHSERERRAKQRREREGERDRGRARRAATGGVKQESSGPRRGGKGNQTKALAAMLVSGRPAPENLRKCVSTGYNQTADLCRLNLKAAFHAADRDHNSMVTHPELEMVLRDELYITLQDPHDDLDIIFTTMVSPQPSAPSPQPSTLTLPT